MRLKQFDLFAQVLVFVFLLAALQLAWIILGLMNNLRSEDWLNLSLVCSVIVDVAVSGISSFDFHFEL